MTSNISRNTLTLGMLAGQQKGLDQLPLPANCHPRKPFVPPAYGHLGLGVEPACQQLQLRGRNPSVLDAVE